MGDAGATALADALYKNDTVHSLALDRNPIRLTGMRAILQMLEHNRFCKVVLPDYVAINEVTKEKFLSEADLATQT